MNHNAYNILQQPVEVQLGWLAALIDGEGSVSVNIDHSKTFNRYYISPHIVIYNHNIDLLEAAVHILSESLGVNVGVHFEGSAGPSITVTGQKQCMKALSRIGNLLIVKNKAASAIIEYCKYRNSLRNLPREQRRMSKIDLDFVKRIRKAQARRAIHLTKNFKALTQQILGGLKK